MLVAFVLSIVPIILPFYDVWLSMPLTVKKPINAVFDKICVHRSLQGKRFGEGYFSLVELLGNSAE
jgi:hypothetical protein